MQYALVYSEDLKELTKGEVKDNLAIMSSDELKWAKLDLPWVDDADLRVGCEAIIWQEQIEDYVDAAIQGLHVMVVALLTEEEYNNHQEFKPAVYVFVEIDESIQVPESVSSGFAPGSRIMMLDPGNTNFRFSEGEAVILTSSCKTDTELAGIPATIRYIKTQMEVEGW